jgi:peptidoglycan/LPS O-acetylase OafA/YrhL
LSGKAFVSHGRRADIDGLRAIAILLVVAYHAFPSRCRGGFIGVDVFFVLSGFLISSNIFRGLADRSFSLLEFYGRRCRRIIPALAVVLIAVTSLSFLVSSGIFFNRLGRHLVAGATFTSNILLLRESGYFDAASELKPFLHLWSLGIEEQFYIFWPALLLLAARLRLKRALVVLPLIAISFVVNVRWAAHHPAKDFYLLQSRFWELLAGCALALFSHASPSANDGTDEPSADWLAFLGLALLFAAAIVIDDKSRFPGWWALLPTVATCLLVAAGPRASLNRHVLSHRAMVFVGLISYPLYLWHWPLLAILRAKQGGEPSAIARLGVVALAVALSVLTYRFVEAPIQRFFSFRRKEWSASPAFAVGSSLALLGLLAVVGFSIQRDLLVSRDSRNHPLAYQLQKYAAYDNSSTQIGRCFVDTSLAFDGFAEPCYRGDGQKPEILLLGDSHAAHLYPGLAEVLRASPVDLLQLNASRCPPLLGAQRGLPDSCRQANEFAFRVARERHPWLVILDAEWTTYSGQADFASSFAETVRSLLHEGVEHVVVIGPVPDWRPALRDVLEKQFLRAGSTLPRRTRIGLDPSLFLANERVRRDATEAGARFISLTDRVCDATGCLTFVGPNVSSDLIVYDTDHLTVAGARYIARSIVAPALVDLLREAED